MKLYVGGISYTTDNEALAEVFRTFGVINSVQVVTDKLTGRSKGFGFVEFADDADALRAITALNAVDFEGRLWTVNQAREMEVRSPRRHKQTFDLFSDKDSIDSPHQENDVDAPPLAEFLCERPIIEISSTVSIALMKYLQAHPMELREINRRRFEELVAEIWSGFGYTVELTKPTRDRGIDVIAIRSSSIVEERYLIECKRPDPGNCVGISPVRALYGVFASDRATKAILATTAHFSKDAIVFFNDHKWQLEGKDFDGLMEWINEYIHRKG